MSNTGQPPGRPAPFNPETEAMLVTYLREQKDADVGGSLKRIADWTQSHEREDAVRHAEIKGELRGHSLRIGALEKNDEKIDGRLDQSGSWQIEAEQAKLIVAQASASKWQERTITIIVGIVMMILGGAGALLFHK